MFQQDLIIKVIIKHTPDVLENIVDQNNGSIPIRDGNQPVKTNNNRPLTSSIAKQQSSFMVILSDSLSQTIDKEMGTGPKTLAQRLACPRPGGIKYYDPFPGG
jgi:hypothetical protein